MKDLDQKKSEYLDWIGNNRARLQERGIYGYVVASEDTLQIGVPKVYGNDREFVEREAQEEYGRNNYAISYVRKNVGLCPHTELDRNDKSKKANLSNKRGRFWKF